MLTDKDYKVLEAHDFEEIEPNHLARACNGVKSFRNSQFTVEFCPDDTDAETICTALRALHTFLCERKYYDNLMPQDVGVHIIRSFEARYYFELYRKNDRLFIFNIGSLESVILIIRRYFQIEEEEKAKKGFKL